ncbi:unnamed protein product [Ectocarpus sp. CCAP 1310/34]|nr:unnamed protein product [Ectocarpus sp. CCAP 1310/34]
MTSSRAYAALRASAAAAGVGGGKTAARSTAGVDFDTTNSSSRGTLLQQKKRKSTSEVTASWKDPRVGGDEDRSGVGTARPTTSASLEHGSLRSSSAEASAFDQRQQQQHQQQQRFPPNVDGSTIPTPPTVKRSLFHNPFMVRSPGLQQELEQTKKQQTDPGSVQESTPAATAATAGDEFHPELSDPVEVFPLDTELRREIGAAVDAEMHRDLGPALAAATVAPGTALHPDVAAVHERVVEEEQARVAGMRVNFDDASASYASFTNMELLRAYVVLRACAITPLVERSDTLLKIGYGVLGESITNAILGKTFFAHFCAGETAEQVGDGSTVIVPRIFGSNRREQVGRRAGALKTRGIGVILDYAAEVDLRPAEERAEREAKKREAGDDRLLREEPAACRTYDYMGEVACDARLMTFLTCVRAVRDQTPGGFAAIKLTALGDPVLLSQITTCVHLIWFESCSRTLIATATGSSATRTSRRDTGMRWFVFESEEDNTALLNLMKRLDPDNRGVIDYVGWSNRMRLDNLAEIAAHCRIPGPMAAAALSENGVALKKTMYRRIATLATAAASSGVRLMIDAEQSWLQPAIDNEVYSLQLEFNTEFPTIFTTYQCYLKDSLERLKTDLDRAARGGYVWAGKLVRGAYMVSERERAKEEGYESPVFDAIEETHANYDAAVTLVLEHIAKGQRAEVMMATHNQKSIEHAIALMQKLGIRRQDGVSFGQLLGMADNITFPLGTGGYKAYKYIPYGKVGETIPYLLRRAQENSGMLGGASHERGLLVKEIRRRVFGG